MNDINSIPVRKRGRVLLIVEGKHEKESFFYFLFKCFPELGIDERNIWIYGTNIYKLYDEIENDYGEEWEDVDLPLLVSRKSEGEPQFKTDFTNIFLVFDYERHDPNFSEEKIKKMQSFFDDATDNGQLYINYPMIESYLDFEQIPAIDYENKKTKITESLGRIYKNNVKNTLVYKKIFLREKLIVRWKRRYNIKDENVLKNCVEQLLNIQEKDCLNELIERTFESILNEKDIQTEKYYFSNLVLQENTILAYWSSMKEIFQEIIKANICKANKIQNGEYEILPTNLKEKYLNLDLNKILNKQNIESVTIPNGYIWVLNTSVFIIADYNFALVLDK